MQRYTTIRTRQLCLVLVTAALAATTAARAEESQPETTTAGEAMDSGQRGAPCFCGLDTSGDDFCFVAGPCNPPCNSNDDCGPGTRCLFANCCGFSICAPDCLQGCEGGGTCGNYAQCSGPGEDCNGNGTSDATDIATGFSLDCQSNDIPDECEEDCQPNGIADECEPDCNANGIADDCDIAGGGSDDCNATGIPDECEVDHNCCETGHGTGCSNQAIQACVCASDPFCCNFTWDSFCANEVLSLGCGSCEGTSEDCNANGVPDECDPDCDSDGIPDDCEPDCNINGIADDCDISGGGSDDCNANGIPDECDIVNNCCETGHGAGCSNPGIQACVCASDPFCCNSTWDGTCANEVLSLGCGSCGAASEDCNANAIPDECDLVVGHNCCTTGHGAGCSDAGIQACVCAFDPFCCNNNWDFICANRVTILGCGSCSPASADCNVNAVPDECDPDADTDGVPDACDACAGGAASGDSDASGTVDLADFVALEGCLIGPDGGLGAGCECFDFDSDGDNDLSDFAAYQALVGP